MYAPLKGFRGLVSLKGSPKYMQESLEFTTFKLDLRKYFQIYENYSFGARINAGFSRGADPQNFYLGGVPNWLNGKYIVNRDVVTASIKDVYFAEFVMPLRGAYYYQQVGNNFILTILELRFPFIPYMQLGLPPIVLGNIHGVLFSDIGMAWKTGEHIDFFGIDDEIVGNGKNPITSFGVGLRTYFIFMMKWDVAWRYNSSGFSKPIFYWSMGIDF
jgi:outer membrane protein assembly factor BamA